MNEYDALIESCRACASGFNTNCDRCMFCRKDNLEKFCHERLHEAAADAIEKLQTPKWIPVTERLPEAERKSYWVCTDTGYQCECRWTNSRFGIGELDEWGWSIFDIPQYQKVMAWMDLPEPYKPPKEET